MSALPAAYPAQWSGSCNRRLALGPAPIKYIVVGLAQAKRNGEAGFTGSSLSVDDDPRIVWRWVPGCQSPFKKLVVTQTGSAPFTQPIIKSFGLSDD